MPILDNARHERFAQELAKGASQLEAYRLAGYEPVEANASRLIRNDKVSSRVAELKAAAAERTITTVHDIATQLDEDRAFAKECEAPSAMVSATMGKAKVLGLIVERAEHTGKDGGPIAMQDVSDQDVVRWMLFEIDKVRRSNPQGATSH